MIQIVIQEIPIAKKRPRFFIRKNPGKGKFLGAINSQVTEEGRAMLQIQNQTNGLPMICGPVRMKLAFIMPIPKSEPKKNMFAMLKGIIKHTKKPDLDNLEKFIKDCMNGIVWKDDCQVVEVHKVKVYETEQLQPRTMIQVEEIDPCECILPFSF